jgi:hypothetical protein
MKTLHIFFLDKRPIGPTINLKPWARFTTKSSIQYNSILQTRRLQNCWQHLPNSSRDKASYKLSGAVAKLASINLLKFGSFSYWFDKPWFHTQRRLTAVLITHSLGVSNWAVIYKTPISTPHHQMSSSPCASCLDLVSCLS